MSEMWVVEELGTRDANRNVLHRIIRVGVRRTIFATDLTFTEVCEAIKANIKDDDRYREEYTGGHCSDTLSGREVKANIRRLDAIAPVTQRKDK